MAKLTVHHLDHSRSHRILWLLEELGVDYEIKAYKRHPKTMRAPKEMQKIHPLGKSPMVETESGDILIESGAVIETLVEEHGPQLCPEAGTEAHRRYRFYMHYAEGSMMSPLLVKLITGRLKSGPLPFFVKPIAKQIAAKIDATFTDPEIELHLGFLDKELASRPFFCGESFTAADIQMSYPLEGAEGRAGLDDRYPNLQGFLARVRERDAYKKAIERGGSPMLGKG